MNLRKRFIMKRIAKRRDSARVIHIEKGCNGLAQMIDDLKSDPSFKRDFNNACFGIPEHILNAGVQGTKTEMQQ